MLKRVLGSTNREVSVVGVGTWQFGGEWGQDFTQAEVDEIFDAARDAGINLVDTAECYGDHLSEKLVGQALRGDRDNWFVATKFGHIFHAPFDRSRDFTGEGMAAQVEKSLRALKMDYVDLLQFHSGDNDEFTTEGLWEAAAKLKEQGKVRHLGISVSNPKTFSQIESADQIGVEVIQIIYNRLDRVPEEKAFPTCIEKNLGVLARVPLASGYLSGKYKPGTTFPSGDVRALHDKEKVRIQLEEVEKIRVEEVPEGVDMASWALAWCLRHSAVTSVIPGCRNAAQVRSNAAAVALL